MKTSLTALLVLAASSSALAQGFGRGDDFGRGLTRVQWMNNMERAMAGGQVDEFERRRLERMGMEPAEKKYIFVYVRPATEEKELNEWNENTVVTASRGSFCFVKMDFDKENPHLKAWGVKAAPAIISCDLHGNDFLKSSSVTSDQIRRLLQSTPPAVQTYVQKLKADYQKALETAKLDELRAAPLFAAIVASGKHGYQEITDSQGKLNEIAEASFRKSDVAESVGPEAGIEFFGELAKVYKATPPAARAEIRIARLEHERGNVQPAIAKLTAVQGYDAKIFKTEIDDAHRVLEEISKAGEAKLEIAQTSNDKESVRKLARDYAGTDAGRKAADAAKRLN
jgi:hypothetical protein